MSAAPIAYDELNALDLRCDPAQFEALTEDEAVQLLVARFRGLTAYGWDWRTAALLAVTPDLPVHASAPWARATAAVSAQLEILQ